MTEQTSAPKVVALNANQWKAVVLNDIGELHSALSRITAPTDIDITNIEQFIGNTRNMLHGWKVAGAQAAAQAAAEAAKGEQVGVAAMPAAHAGNGAAPIKKGGWPKGKKRGGDAAAVSQ